MPESAEPRRLRWSVPAADVSTNEWLDRQENISRSLQLLIRESIQRDGYIDVVNRPIEQLPRRGRPPAAAEADENDETDGAATGHTQVAKAQVPSSARATATQMHAKSEPEAQGDVEPATTAESGSTPGTQPQPAKRPGNPDAAAGIAAMMDLR
jgi:hypothetical protein